MAQTPTPSQANLGATFAFIPSIHDKVYPDIDPSTIKLPEAFVVCIVGARGPIAAGIARSYAKAGASGFVLCARNVEGLKDISDEIKQINPSARVLSLKCDVTSPQSVAAAAEAAKSEFDSKLDSVIVNSGFVATMEFDITKTDDDACRQTFEVNVLGTYYAAHYFIPLLMAKKNEGDIKSFIAVSSIGATTVAGPIAHPPYDISKMAQSRIIEMISEQAAHKELFVASIHPGGVMSNLAEAMPESHRHLLQDDENLGGAFLVWLTSNQKASKALNGRFLSAKWDVKQLEERYDDIVSQDLLRFRLAV